MSNDTGKYNVGNLLPALRIAAKLREEMLKLGFTDNGGAIHSAERIVDILGSRLKYPEIRHTNDIKKLASAEKTSAARIAQERGEPVVIEHVAPLRDLTRETLKLIMDNESDSSVQTFIKDNYRLVLLTPWEMNALNKINRSKMDNNRLASAGIYVENSVK